MNHEIRDLIDELIEDQKVYVRESKTIKCSNCDKSLLDVVLTREDENQQRTYKVHCPYCGDKSFPTTFLGVTSIAPPERMFIDDYKMSGVVHEIKVKCKK